MKIKAGIDSALPVQNWAWHGPHALKDAAALWDPEVPPALTGQYAFHLEQDGKHLLLRDALGVNKLFYSIDSDGCVHSSNYLFDLRVRRRPIESIYSVPSGHRLQLCPENRTLRLDKVRTLPFGREKGPADIAVHAGRIRQRLDAEFRRIQLLVGDRPLYVTLSGGLDSTVIAAVAQRFLPRLRALTFCLGEESASRVPGADLYYAQHAADSLGLPLDVVCVDSAAITALLDLVLVYGQDWRPFNVHCGLVNAAIGAWLARTHPDGARPVVLTGDTMNELLADYTAVTYGGEVHYSLPRLDAGRLRRFLVGGLDAGDREVGIFRHFGIDTIEAYACCADAYTALPEFFVTQPHAKRRLVEHMLIEGIPQCIYDRPKVRAQAGSSVNVAGTLACLIDQGFDASHLAARFAALFEITISSLAGLVRGGYYRFTSVYPEGAT
jgi:asparagine synthetase B (glutamine-hydrolysing)